LINAPIFLNADEYEKLTPTPTPIKKVQVQVQVQVNEKEEEEEESKNDDCGVWASQSLLKRDDNNKTWAHKLFGDVVKANKVLQAKENDKLVEAKKRDRLHQMRVESVLPATMRPRAISRESSIVSTTIASPMSTRSNRYELSPSPASTATATTTTTTTTTTTSTTSSICKPSAEATEWRMKQIKLGKQTQGYLNFIKIYPDKDLRFRLSNNLCSTPDKNERIGKKRWGGKYKKWRKFLHKFDDMETEQQQTEQQ